ncbi:uncharacterized protein TRIADDRAFT_57821 [Trichoplax adhaerens]|uniref:Fibronectin type-III domain-containing protein n=1 Tax=Trichoplax adhaerens TaxID=10228 RepID=B3S1N0_TRIAD|nr:hypothetical protein TRIADDRAFT_57821 [Trichoplax adhaerens]EDV23321.1 hypothetical protein TRIADDRAFT_57821 [Trichoplax adhaerens]|eukprot:XP_002114231.1 hypothetical protein TRIADDRAFT_57821 [Trichoplax adhaerens]
MAKWLKLCYMLLLFNVAALNLPVTEAILATPSGKTYARINEDIILLCTAKKTDNSGRNLELLTLTLQKSPFPRLMLIIGPFNEYMTGEIKPSNRMKSFYNKTSTEVTLGLTIKNLVTSDGGNYIWTASYQPNHEKVITTTVVVMSPPEPPASFKPENLTNSSVYFSWKPGYDNGFRQHFIIRCKAQGLSQHLVNTETNQTSLTMKGLRKNTLYICSLSARNRIGDSGTLGTMFITGNYGPNPTDTVIALTVTKSTTTFSTSPIQTTTTPIKTITTPIKTTTTNHIPTTVASTTKTHTVESSVPTSSPTWLYTDSFTTSDIEEETATVSIGQSENSVKTEPSTPSSTLIGDSTDNVISNSSDDSTPSDSYVQTTQTPGTDEIVTIENKTPSNARRYLQTSNYFYSNLAIRFENKPKTESTTTLKSTSSAETVVSHPFTDGISTTTSIPTMTNPVAVTTDFSKSTTANALPNIDGGSIIGISVGLSCVLVMLVISGIIFVMKRKSNHKKREEVELFYFHISSNPAIVDIHFRFLFTKLTIDNFINRSYKGT